MKYYVYILRNEAGNKTYVGYSSNPANRLKEHNNGESIYTSRFKPWDILYTEEYDNRKDAVKREKYFKSSSGRRLIKKKFFDI